MAVPLYKLIAIVLLAVQGLGLVVPGGTVVCVNPWRCAEHAPEPAGSEDAGCSCCCRETEGERPSDEAHRPCSPSHTCCITVPAASPKLRIEAVRDGEFERSLKGSGIPVEVRSLEAPSWSLAAARAWSLPPPDRGAGSLAVGLSSTRLLI